MTSAPDDDSLPAVDVDVEIHRDEDYEESDRIPTGTPKYTEHERGEGPAVPDGSDEMEPDNVDAADLGTGALEAALVTPEDLTILRNTSIAAVIPTGASSTVNEPSLATRDQIVFFTGNWYAARSRDGGKTFKYVDPHKGANGFCCDQVVLYVPAADMFFWLRQFIRNNQGENIQRISFARAADLATDSVAWRHFDLTSAGLGLSEQWLDFPDMAYGANALYITSNVFRQKAWTCTIIVRIPLAGFTQEPPKVQPRVFRSTQRFNFRAAQACDTRIYWASENSSSSLRVYYWDEGSQDPSHRDVTVPKATLMRRMLGGTRGPDGQLWFAWTATRTDRPHPYVRIVRLAVNGNDVKFAAAEDVWSSTQTFDLPALTTNLQIGEVGISYGVKGDNLPPSHGVGILTGKRKFVIAVRGRFGTNRWGDYMSIRQHHPNSPAFAAAGYAMTASADRGDPHFVLFGRGLA